MRKLTIDRQTWLRGESDEDSFLLRSRDNKMCCLGFYAKSLGIPEEQILDRPTPTDTEVAKLFVGLVDIDAKGRPVMNQVCSELMGHNDNPSPWLGDSQLKDPDAVREGHIQRLFQQIDVAVEFVN